MIDFKKLNLSQKSRQAGELLLCSLQASPSQLPVPAASLLLQTLNKFDERDTKFPILDI